MVDIEKIILEEKMKVQPDWLYIGILDKMRLGDCTEFNFAQTGRMISRENFLRQRPQARLHKDCIEVAQYVGGFYIQLLSSARFFLNLNDAEQEDEVSTTFDSKEISEVEHKLWQTIAKQYFRN
jgi:hypothetical protein